MKKISLFVLALCTSAAVFAQDNQPQLRTPMAKKIMFGLDVGVNLARLDANEGDFPAGMAPSANTKTAMHAAAFVSIPLGTSMFSLKPQLMYSKQGSKLRVGTTDSEMDLDYIYAAPAAFEFKTPGGFLIETGPMLGFLLGASAEDIATNTSVDIKVEIKKLDFMWSGGIGFMSRIGLGVHARYNHGFSNVLNSDDASTPQPGKLQNRVFQFGLMYHFGAHK